MWSFLEYVVKNENSQNPKQSRLPLGVDQKMELNISLVDIA